MILLKQLSFTKVIQVFSELYLYPWQFMILHIAYYKKYLAFKMITKMP